MGKIKKATKKVAKKAAKAAIKAAFVIVKQETGIKIPKI